MGWCSNPEISDSGKLPLLQGNRDKGRRQDHSVEAGTTGALLRGSEATKRTQLLQDVLAVGSSLLLPSSLPLFVPEPIGDHGARQPQSCPLHEEVAQKPRTESRPAGSALA